MDNFSIKIANKSHFHFLSENDKHISKEMLEKKLVNEEILIMEVNDVIVGWLRFNFFWDEIPFMNMLYFFEEYRRKGYGKIFVAYWEKILVKKGFKRFLISTMVNEKAQHFYRKLGYNDIGGFVLPTEPLELIMMKDKT